MPGQGCRLGSIVHMELVEDGADAFGQEKLLGDFAGVYQSVWGSIAEHSEGRGWKWPFPLHYPCCGNFLSTQSR